ncbi:MAG: TerB family tellurite resistance protein [Nitrospira sp.]|nr:TerB family tellurite resistance protein [Nitrospira sp.]MBH0182901.1 TerB family tellurite resistance protein [Nitrospira sp.]MBH0186212.1 TerB family tellurite resistance protein [Nitrospira sp.]
MELKMPTHEQAYWGFRAIKTVTLADGEMTASERNLLESIQRMHGTTYSIEELEPITPEELAREISDPQLRQQLVQGFIVMSLIDGKPNAQETDLVEQFAQALEVSVPEVKNLRHVLKGEILQLRLDLVRRVWLRPKVKEIWNGEGIRGLFKFVRGMMGRYENKELAARYQALEHYPVGSLGRSYWEYCRKNGFALPGEKGGAPEQILFHDCAHILSGYGTAPEEEVQVACFSAGFQRRDPFTFVLFVLLQFHVGVRMTPITEARTGFFDPEKAMIALRRGAAMNIDLNDGWDYRPVMGEQVEDLRRRYNILPVEAFLPASRQAIGSAA